MLITEGQYVNIHAHRFSSGPGEWVLSSLKSLEYPPDANVGAYYSVGLHPWELESGAIDISNALKKVRLAVENCQVLAVGEAGIDKLIKVPLDLQLQVFRFQVEIAELADLPVIIHAVKAWQELIRFSREFKPSVPMIIHGFRGSQQLADELIREGFYLSFGQALLHSETLRAVFASLPEEKIFLESDESEEEIIEIYRMGAESSGMEQEALGQIIARNTNELFTRK